MNIGVTGPRTLTFEQRCTAQNNLRLLLGTGTAVTLHVGDADGLDKLAWEMGLAHSPVLYYKNRKLPYRAQAAERSTRMVRVLCYMNGTLHAWPNKPAPQGLMPSRNWPKGANGSGTWGTIALAVGLEVPVVLHWLVDDVPAPDWLEQTQMALL